MTFGGNLSAESSSHPWCFILSVCLLSLVCRYCQLVGSRRRR